MNPLPAPKPTGGFFFLHGQNIDRAPPAEPFVKISGADLIVTLLERHGVRTVAGIPGGAILPLYDALSCSRRIRHVLARHEQAAGFISQGMARVSGRAGVCLVTSGPGVTNIVTALADAKLDSVPLICLAGQVPTHLIGTDAFQEVATVDLVRPITKACYLVKSATEISDVLAEAFEVAESGRPGPVLIDLPKNVQTQIIDWQPTYPAPRSCRQPAQHVAGLAAAYDRAAALIRGAKRPLLYYGGGVVKARATKLARDFAHVLNIPVATSLMALGILPAEHPLNLGMLGMHGARSTNHAIDAADVLIAIGARFDDRATGDAAAFAVNARIIHIDIDSRELGKIKQPTVAIRDDAASAFRELLLRMRVYTPDEALRSAWHSHIHELQRAFPRQDLESQALCSPHGIMQGLGRVLTDDTIVTTDVGQHQMWAAQALPLKNADRWLTSGGLGTMGFGLPAAIGAALVSQPSPVICITGDGSLMMNVQELATLAELQLNVKIVLLDNAALGMVRQQQELLYGERYIASKFPGSVDWMSIAMAFGIPACNLAATPDSEIVLTRAMATYGPLLIRVAIDEVAKVMPMVRPGSANTIVLDSLEC
jgi:acetolactate synthase I/II/III large subunit